MTKRIAARSRRAMSGIAVAAITGVIASLPGVNVAGRNCTVASGQRRARKSRGRDWRCWTLEVAPRVGLEPTTNGLTVRRSTAELPGNGAAYRRPRILKKGAGAVKLRLRVYSTGSRSRNPTPFKGIGSIYRPGWLRGPRARQRVGVFTAAGFTPTPDRSVPVPWRAVPGWSRRRCGCVRARRSRSLRRPRRPPRTAGSS